MGFLKTLFHLLIALHIHARFGLLPSGLGLSFSGPGHQHVAFFTQLLSLFNGHPLIRHGTGDQRAAGGS
jgi:hypothetical protein